MSTAFYLKFDGVEGESTLKDHKGEIVVLSWAWGASQASAVSPGGGSGKGKAVAGEFQFTHPYDKASPMLAKQCVSGKHFKEAKLVARKAGEGQKDYLLVTLKEVFISSVQASGAAGGEVSESVSCSYADIEFSYKPQDAKGALGAEVKFGWNTKTSATR
ncbi:Hcp family type VI secretion system effector [Roseateles violae]|uniref:Type VI secretion system tube protein Hcp n=1 Tax=Roseateles violae TaxID=3058042 RepID=A0ABT8DRJ7_9BURK|nr:type VI secretion system tube protein Hcp [Pelomonas sp. PFR6]MDN3920598.1 type VI secretion system tube protein Hcp [Pelomonas sp. PFR6]